MKQILQTNQLNTAESWVLLGNLRADQLIKKLPAFYRTQWFITVFRRESNWTLSWARWIQTTASYPITLRYILILSSHVVRAGVAHTV